MNVGLKLISKSRMSHSKSARPINYAEIYSVQLNKIK